MLTLSAKSDLPCNEELPRAGREFVTYAMYATLALVPVRVDEQGRTEVEIHWVGMTKVSAHVDFAVQWTQEGQRPHQRSILPADPGQLVLLRPGLPPTPFTDFGTVAPALQPLWWADWQQRAQGSELTLAPQETLLVWDFGANINPFASEPESRLETTAVAYGEAGEVGRIGFKWHPQFQLTYDIAYKVRLDELESEGKRDEAAGVQLVQEVIPAPRWRAYLAKLAWLRAAEEAPAMTESNLGLSLRVHLGLQAGEEFLVRRFGYYLSHYLSAKATPPANALLRLLTRAFELGMSGVRFHATERDLRVWPPPVVEEKPLRPMPLPPATMLARLSNIKARLERLRELDARFSIHGASTHRYILNPCLNEHALQTFEDRYHIVLPEEYRAFLLYVGHGQAGPSYGLVTLREARKFSFGALDQPFPHREPYHPEIVDEEVTENEDDEKSYQEVERVDEFAEFPWHDTATDGALYLGTEGCGIHFLLVVSGDERGQMWCDDRSNDGGITPMTDKAGQTYSFLDWYEAWLDASLAKLKT